MARRFIRCWLFKVLRVKFRLGQKDLINCPAKALGFTALY